MSATHATRTRAFALRRALVFAAATLVLFAAGQASAKGDGTGTSAAARGSLSEAAARVRAELAGLRQHGLLIGRPTAPVRIVEYADLLSPQCASTANGVLPRILNRFVRNGVASLQFEPLAQSPLSDQFALGAYAAGTEHHAWDYILLAYQRTAPRITARLESPADLVSALGLPLRRWQANLRRRRWTGHLKQATRVVVVGGFKRFPVVLVRGHQGGFLPIPSPRPVILTPPVTFAKLSAAIRTAARHARLGPPPAVLHLRATT